MSRSPYLECSLRGRGGSCVFVPVPHLFVFTPVVNNLLCLTTGPATLTTDADRAQGTQQQSSGSAPGHQGACVRALARLSRPGGLIDGKGSVVVAREVLEVVVLGVVVAAAAVVLDVNKDAAISPWLTASHPNSEVKQGRVAVVLRWGTTREGAMLHLLFLRF